MLIGTVLTTLQRCQSTGLVGIRGRGGRDEFERVVRSQTGERGSWLPLLTEPKRHLFPELGQRSSPFLGSYWSGERLADKRYLIAGLALGPGGTPPSWVGGLQQGCLGRSVSKKLHPPRVGDQRVYEAQEGRRAFCLRWVLVKCLALGAEGTRNLPLLWRAAELPGSTRAGDLQLDVSCARTGASV